MIIYIQLILLLHFRDGNGSELDRVHVDPDPDSFSRVRPRTRPGSAGLDFLFQYPDPWIL